jgi:ribonuclease HI
VGGVLFGPRGTTELVYSWSLGHATNNQAKALLQGLALARARNTRKFIILGDLKNTISHLRLGSPPEM